MNTNHTTEAIKTIISQVYIDSEDLFHVRGRAFQVTRRTAYHQWKGPLQSFGENTGDDTRKREQLLAELTGCIYSTFYVSGNPKGEWFDEETNPPAEEKNEFMNRLSAANQTVETWDPNWTVYSTDPMGQVTVEKNGKLRQLVPNEWQPMLPMNGPLQPGAKLSLLNRKERRDLQPVFYYVYGKEFLPLSASMGRFYFNLKPESTARFIQLLTSAFNQFRVPFMFKCLNHPSLFTRTDSAVLYLDKCHFRIAARLLGRILKQEPNMFKEAVPLFTRPIAPGLSYAEDPGNGKSFGMFWSEILAEGIVLAFEKGGYSKNKKEELILRQFKKHGVDPEASHLRTHSFYPYDFSLFQ